MKRKPNMLKTLHASIFFRTLSVAVAVLMFSPAFGHGPSRQKVVESIEVDAPAARVWALVGDFAAGWPKWHPVIEGSTADKGNAVGSLRHLTIKGGKFLDEELEGYDTAAMSFKYRIKSGDALPVTNYSSMIKISIINGEKCSVEWRGAFYRGYPNNDPPPDRNDEAALAAVTGVYKIGLANLKAVAEKK
jgi:hypothetical protein